MKNQKFQNYSKYSGMAFQLLGAILIGTYLGLWIDSKMQNKLPIGAALGSLLGICAGLYASLKDLFKKDESSKQDNDGEK